MKRKEILANAAKITLQDRNISYSEPEDNFGCIASMMRAYFQGRTLNTIAAHDVAAIMIMVKLSRIRQSPEKPDHWIDLAGYAACGGECATRGQVQ